MRASCSHCGAQQNLDDEGIAPQSQVRFRCWMCGRNNVLDVTPTKHPELTRILKPPLPVAWLQNAPSVEGTAANRSPGLALPKDKTITVSVIAGPSKGLKHQLTRPLVIVGRPGGDADIEINDPEVSRLHCALEVKQDLILLRDLDSTNGTYLREKRVRAAALEHLSEFRVGSSVLLVTIFPKQDAQI